MIGTGSSVEICAEAYEKLVAQGIRVRLVSMPSWELFEQQGLEYRNSVLPPDIASRVSVEQGSTFGWSRYIGSSGTAIGMETFGASAPMKQLLMHFGFTVEHVVSAAKAQLTHRSK